jgi:hypothetical protein
MTTRTRLKALLSATAASLVLAGCSTGSLDPHRPKTITASEEGGQVSLSHGQRLFVPLKSEPGNDWKRIEPPIMMIIAESAPELDGVMFTTVRSGTETLVFQKADRKVTYEIEVR